MKISNCHYDGLGNVVAISDDGRQITEKYEYDVYGEPTIWDWNAQQIVDSSIVGNPYMFTGRRFDSETSLYYYRARYYSPYSGRFLQTDPVGYAAGLNLYTYVDNNPINWVDPWGLKTNLIKHAIGAAYHGAVGGAAWAANEATKLPPAPSLSEQAGPHPVPQGIAKALDAASTAATLVEEMTGCDWEEMAAEHGEQFKENLEGLKSDAEEVWDHWKKCIDDMFDDIDSVLDDIADWGEDDVSKDDEVKKGSQT